MVPTHPLRPAVALAAAALLVAGLPVVTAAPASAAAEPVPVYLDTRYSFEERSADLVSRMTLPEKVLQLHTNNAPAIPRLGVQQYTYWSEGQHGINRLGANTDSGTVTGDPHATSFPTNFAATDVLGPGADPAGDHGDLRRGPRCAGQVAVGSRAEQHRAGPRTTTGR